MKKVIILVVVLILGLGTFLFLSLGDDNKSTIENNPISPPPTDLPPNTENIPKPDDLPIVEDIDDEVQTGQSGTKKTISITGKNFKFTIDGVNNPDIIINQGDIVRIEFASTQGFHDFVVDEFNLRTTRVQESDGIVSAEFIADTKGTFEYYCSVGSHRAAGMFGKLIVN